MEVRDPVHGSIEILDEYKPILEHPFFQRLRGIKQLGFSEYAFPGATHTRYIHSIGVMKISEMVSQKIFKNMKPSADLTKLKETLKLACLMHDIGHAPLSHTTEYAMPQVSELLLPESLVLGSKLRQATHEDYTIKSIVNSSFSDSFKMVEEKFGIDKTCVAELVMGKTDNPDYFMIDGINYFPLLHQLVSSEMDCDRMDYLLRDSYFCGVSYGKYDLDWLIDNLKICIEDNNAYLGISERAVSTFDDFLLSRFHMFLMVYFHYRAVCLEKMLYRYFKSASNEYQIPADIEKYLEHDDHHFLKFLRSSDNTWAKRIVKNDIPKKVFELYGDDKNGQLNRLEDFLTDGDIDYIKCSSTGRLSKYYSSEDLAVGKYSMKVFSEHKQGYSNINEASDLYTKFSKSHTVDRIHLDYDKLSDSQNKEIKSIINAI
jgi:HD superfamily phosphohydrolase